MAGTGNGQEATGKADTGARISSRLKSCNTLEPRRECENEDSHSDRQSFHPSRSVRKNRCALQNQLCKG